jgi:hypothetical protein
MDGIGLNLNELRLHAQANSDAINALLPAIVENARLLGVDPPAVEPVASAFAGPQVTRQAPRPESAPSPTAP